MDTDHKKILYKKESEAVIGSAIEVHKELGHGFLEKPYENALVAEFSGRSIPVQQQSRSPIYYKATQVGEFIPDLIVFSKIIIDTKVIEAISSTEIG